MNYVYVIWKSGHLQFEISVRSPLTGVLWNLEVFPEVASTVAKECSAYTDNQSKWGTFLLISISSVTVHFYTVMHPLVPWNVLIWLLAGLFLKQQ